MATPYDNSIIWLHWMGRVVREKTIRELAQTVKKKAPSTTGIAIKTNDGKDWQGRYDTDPEMEINGPNDIFKWTRELALNGLKTHLWCVVRGVDPNEEADVIIEACKVSGVKSMILDVEGGPQYFGGRPASVARQVIERIRGGIPSDFHLALNYDYRGGHPASIHIDEWLPHVQSLHPMVYWWHFSESTRGPKRYLDEMFTILAKYNKPIVPMLQSYPDPSTNFMVPPEQMEEGGVYSFEKGGVGISYFRLGSFVDDSHYAAVGRVNPSGIDLIPPDPVDTGDPASTFQVITIGLNVRTHPSTEERTLLPDKQLQLGDKVKVLPTSRIENEGFIWWRHKDGWSAEKDSSGSTVFMIRSTDTGGGGSGGGGGTPDNVLQVVTLSLNVRSEPSSDPSTLIESAQLRMGEQVTVDKNSRREALGFVWWHHDRGGWSAEKTIDGSEIYLSDANADLPPTEFHFSRSPMDLDAMRWFYYYGNTRFAYFYGAQHNYDGYSQGLHGGLDFGYPAKSGNTIPIFAGVHGTFDYSGSGRAFGPNRVDILTNGYLLIYGHVANPIRLARGTAVTPDTIVGWVDTGAKHMHLEIRKGGYLYNPILFMPRAMREMIFREFQPTGNFAFFQNERWNKWITPLDQPRIKLGGPVIGPRA